VQVASACKPLHASSSVHGRVHTPQMQLSSPSQSSLQRVRKCVSVSAFAGVVLSSHAAASKPRQSAA
jgi:hypothetical protein